MTIELENNCTYTEIPELIKKMTSEKTNNDTVHIKLLNVSNIDLSMLQFLISIKKSNPGDKMSITIEAEEDIKTLLHNTGFSYILNK